LSNGFGVNFTTSGRWDVKPLSEWDSDVLTSKILDGYYDAEALLAELLRREREAMRARCARACGEVAIFLRANGMAESVHITEACTAAIQELQ
jgi:hypothetical protein